MTGCPDVADTATIVRAIDMLVTHLLADTAYEVGEGDRISAGYFMRVFQGPAMRGGYGIVGVGSRERKTETENCASTPSGEPSDFLPNLLRTC